MLREKDAEKKKELQQEFSAAVARGDREAARSLPRSGREARRQPGCTRCRHVSSPRRGAEQADCRRCREVREGRSGEGLALRSALRGRRRWPRLPRYSPDRRGWRPSRVAAIEPAAKAMTDEHPAAIQSTVLSAYQTALAKAGKSERGQGDRCTPRQAGNGDRRRVPEVGPAIQADGVRGTQGLERQPVVMMELFTGRSARRAWPRTSPSTPS